MASAALVQLTDHTWLIPGPTNIGVVERDGEAWLIDSGNDKEHGRKIRKALDERGWSLQGIVNTHSNADHIGGNDYLQRQTGCEIWASPVESAFIEYPRLEPAFLWGGYPVKELFSKFFEAKPSKVTHPIEFEAGQTNAKAGNKEAKPGKSSDGKGSGKGLGKSGGGNGGGSRKKGAGGGNGRGGGGGGLPPETEGVDWKEIAAGMRAVRLPGHFFDMIGVLSDDGVFFLGDALFGPKVLEKYRIPFIYDVRSYKETIGRVREIDAAHYVVSHGEPTSDIGETADVNLALLEGVEAALLEITGREKGFDEILKAVCDRYGIELDIGQYVLVGTTVRSFLSYLYNEGKLGYEFRENRMYWMKA